MKKYSLKFFYGDSIPPKHDLTILSPAGSRIDLEPYISPFKGQRSDLIIKFGSDYSAPLDDIFEEQVEVFYQKVIRVHWNRKADPPTRGFEVSFKRACRAGVLHRCGFQPKTREQIEEQECRAAEQQAKEKKDQKLKNLICHKLVYRYLERNGIIHGEREPNEEDLESTRFWLRELKRQQKVRTPSDVIAYCERNTGKG